MQTNIEFKCPNCGASLQFDSNTQNMRCEYCESEFDVESVRRYNDEQASAADDDIDWGEATQDEWHDDDGDGLGVYVCDSCGGEIVADANTAATSCPYCGNPVVMSGRLSGVLKPDYVIPFKLDKNAAKARLSEHFKGKRLLPKLFKKEATVNEIKGIYVPFWLFDADVCTDMRFRTTKVRCWSDSRYNYTETSHYSVVRGGNLGFSHIPADASSKMPDVLMESLEPYDFSEAVSFETAYLSGYLADKYDVLSATCEPRVNQRIKRSTEDCFSSTVQGYTTVQLEHSRVGFNDRCVKYALYPVWLLNTEWNGQKFTFAVNGQTGKIVGDLPLDKGAYWRWFSFIAGSVAAGAFLLMLLFLFGGAA